LNVIDKIYCFNYILFTFQLKDRCPHRLIAWSSSVSGNQDETCVFSALVTSFHPSFSHTAGYTDCVAPGAWIPWWTTGITRYFYRWLWGNI